MLLSAIALILALVVTAAALAMWLRRPKLVAAHISGVAIAGAVLVISYLLGLGIELNSGNWRFFAYPAAVLSVAATSIALTLLLPPDFLKSALFKLTLGATVLALAGFFFNLGRATPYFAAWGGRQFSQFGGDYSSGDRLIFTSLVFTLLGAIAGLVSGALATLLHRLRFSKGQHITP